MIKLKDILFEGKAPSIFIPRRTDDRVDRLVKNYLRNGSKGDLDLSEMDLVELPAILSNVTVGGDFDCHYNRLTSLSGAPQHVGGDFDCYSNLLTSLTGAPQHVGGGFSCSLNKLTSLTGSPQHIGANFICNHNPLTSLNGAPQSVGRDFHCKHNAVKFTEAQVRAVCDVKGKVYV